MATSPKKHVLITFGRSFLTLNLARLMSAAGHRVTVVDSIPIGVSRFSNSVDAFHKVPAPKFEPRDYCRELARIVVDEKVDMVIPIHEETDILSMMVGLFPPECEVFLSDFDTENKLHNKYDFQRELVSLGIPTLKFAVVEGPDDAAALDFDVPFAFKQCYSRGSQKVHKITPGQNLDWVEYDSTNPWLAQEWMEGKRYCTYSVCRDGKVNAHATYPVSYAIGGSSCLSFTSIEHQPILDWITEFVAAQSFTGQAGFDFIEGADGSIYCIECNPRSTSGIMMFRPHNDVPAAFFGDNDDLIVPDSDVDRMIGLGMLLYGWTKASRQGRSMRQFWKDFHSYEDVIFERGDMKPGIMLPVAYASILRECRRYHVGLAEGFMHDHEWDGHPI